MFQLYIVYTEWHEQINRGCLMGLTKTNIQKGNMEMSTISVT